MTMQAELVEMLRALLRGDFDAVDAYVDEAEGKQEVWDAGTSLLNSAFWLAVNRRFSANTNLQEISDYVANVRQEYPGTETLVAEGLIRAAARGEDHLMSGMDPDTAVPVEMVLLYKLVSDAALTEEQRADFVAEAVETAEQSLPN